MNRIWRGIFLLTGLLLILCAASGCTQKETGPTFQTAYVIDEYAKLVGTTQCLVDGDSTSDAVARIEMKDGVSTGVVYTNLVSQYGLGLPALGDEDGRCIVYTADKCPVIRVLDWEEIYYVIPAQSEEAARKVLETFMRAYAESMGIAEE